MNAPPPFDAATCPHCGGRTVLASSGTLRWVCGACGGPRVPGFAGGTSASDLAVMRDLVDARRARAAEVGWTAAAIALTFTLLIALTVAAAAWLASHLAGGILFAFALLFLALTLVARGRALERRTQWKGALDRGWTAAAQSILGTRGGETTAAELAGMLRIAQEDAEAILANLSVTNRARVEVGDDAELRYRVDAPDEASAQAEALAASSESPRRRAEGT